MRRRDVHTTPNPTGNGWVNEVNGKVVSHHQRQDTAIDRGREIAIDHHAEHVIHGRNGQIRDSNSYGNDPCPPRDKR
ncbi:MAG: DUF2188 domain-containing protein [Terriglobia bacterium]|nr:DUF2188 domain-containing protein [Terriglobia bacterium]